MDSNITVYGKNDCEDTQRVRQFLDSRGTAYRYVNIEQDKAGEELVKKENDDKVRTPLVQVCFGTECRVLRVPGNEELENALRDLEPFESAA